MFLHQPTSASVLLLFGCEREIEKGDKNKSCRVRRDRRAQMPFHEFLETRTNYFITYVGALLMYHIQYVAQRRKVGRIGENA